MLIGWLLVDPPAGFCRRTSARSLGERALNAGKTEGRAPENRLTALARGFILVNSS
jgi:hypothetical protein